MLTLPERLQASVLQDFFCVMKNAENNFPLQLHCHQAIILKLKKVFFRMELNFFGGCSTFFIIFFISSASIGTDAHIYLLW